MSLSDAAAIITIAGAFQRVLARLRKGRKTTKRWGRGRRRKHSPPTDSQKRDRELTKKLLENPIDAIKEMGTEFVASNRRKIVRNLEDYMLQEIQK
jgi:hypothetical protein